ncbi:hypothetical protein AR505_0564 [methanogenic archaeon ISO4-H5]|nr:hypothetical protein AR505_0564 [methanogenic archaeon ISO4-H5]
MMTGPQLSQNRRVSVLITNLSRIDTTEDNVRFGASANLDLDSLIS